MTAAGWQQVFEGSSLNEYTIPPGGAIGAGHFGMVFRATNSVTGKLVALKVLAPNSSPVDSNDFENEGRLLERLSGSRNVVDIDEASAGTQIEINANGVKIPLQVSYHVLEEADGSIADLIVSRKDSNWKQHLLIWRDLVRGIHQMHMKRVAHRDLKASNCLVFTTKSTKIYKIADLGRSRDLAGSARHPKEVYPQGLGDFTFGAPEYLYLQGEDTERAHRDADLYGIGSLLYEMVTGVGLTSHIAGDVFAVRKTAVLNSQRGHITDLDSLRSRYENAISIFEADIPAPIRKRISDMLRIMCDPVPARRRAIEGKQRPHSPYSLETVLRTIDIAARQLDLAVAQAAKTTIRKGA